MLRPYLSFSRRRRLEPPRAAPRSTSAPPFSRTDRAPDWSADWPPPRGSGTAQTPGPVPRARKSGTSSPWCCGARSVARGRRPRARARARRRGGSRRSAWAPAGRAPTRAGSWCPCASDTAAAPRLPRGGRRLAGQLNATLGVHERAGLFGETRAGQDHVGVAGGLRQEQVVHREELELLEPVLGVCDVGI